jgi:cytidine deaminase
VVKAARSAAPPSDAGADEPTDVATPATVAVSGGGAPVLDGAVLIAEAHAARANAYAPYSRFLVGAAVLGASGRVYRGCNVESASYPTTCCAERVAVYNAVVHGERDILAVAVVTDTDPPACPCGGCRQVLFEFGPDAVVFAGNVAGDLRRTTVRELLPDGFDGRVLGR